MKNKTLLDRVGLSFECPMDWEAMEGEAPEEEEEYLILPGVMCVEEER